MKRNPEAVEFVHRHVHEFSERHWRKLNEINPEKSRRDLILESGNEALITAMQHMDEVETELKDLQAHMDDLIENFHEEHNQTVHELVMSAHLERLNLMQRLQDNFEHKIKSAIGLVELVSTKKAYAVLEECRNQIRKLGQEY